MVIETDLSIADDDELLDMLRDSGCREILIGFEGTTFSEVDQVETAGQLESIESRYVPGSDSQDPGSGVRVNGCFLLGLDGTGTESFERIHEFVRQSGLYDVQITAQTVFPGTPLYARLLKEGRILREEAWVLCTLGDVNFRPKAMDRNLARPPTTGRASAAHCRSHE
jgi:radical SAM superfamily enzyme YgiQ (UPF0313 family)